MIDDKPLDVQSAVMALASRRVFVLVIRTWKYLVDGDGGDENLKDYPIEENPELTIRSVLNNTMLYQEGLVVWSDQALVDVHRRPEPRAYPLFGPRPHTWL